MFCFASQLVMLTRISGSASLCSHSVTMRNLPCATARWPTWSCSLFFSKSTRHTFQTNSISDVCWALMMLGRFKGLCPVASRALLDC